MKVLSDTFRADLCLFPVWYRTGSQRTDKQKRPRRRKLLPSWL